MKWLHIRLRLESLDDTDDADDSMFVDFCWLLGVVAKVKNRRHSVNQVRNW